MTTRATDALPLDTSLLVAALTPEYRTSAVQQWLAGQPPEHLRISEWGISRSPCPARSAAGYLSEAHRAEALAAFTSLIEESLDVLTPVRADFRTAAHFADQAGIGLRAGDALHFAIASSHGATLWTLDRKFLLAAPAVAVSAKEP